MPFSRRHLLASSASLAAACAMRRTALGQAAEAQKPGDQTPPPVPPPAPDRPVPQLELPPVPPPSTAAAKALFQIVGAASYTQLEHRLRYLNADLVTNGMRGLQGGPGAFLTGYPNNEFYDWDLYFENLYLSYYGVWPYCFTNLKEFLNRQQPDGYISRSLINKRDRQHFKPFLAQLVVLGAAQNHDDYTWLRGNCYDRLAKYLDKWFTYDGDHNGLPVWNSADAAGTDNQWSRGGALASFQTEGVDLASYLVRELRAMAVIATHLGIKADATAFNQHADALIKLINEVFWDEKQGMYFDRNEKTGQPIYVKSATNFTPLFAGAMTPERAQRTIHQHLLNPNEFWLAYPVASYAKTEPDYYQGAHFDRPTGTHRECNWRGPTWAPTNYMIFQGLRRYGYNAEARELALRLFNMALNKNSILREYYNAETGEGLGKDRFWGFTDLYYGMLLESLLDYDASALDKPQQPILTQQLGIEFPPLPAL